LGVFGEINPPALPFSLPTMYLVAVFYASPAEVGQQKSLRIVLLTEDGKEVLAMDLPPMEVPPAKRAGSGSELQMVFCLNGVGFDRPGNYAFHFLVGGDTKASLPLRVNEPQPGES